MLNEIIEIGSQNNMKKLKILVADDEETILRLYDQILSNDCSSMETESEIDDLESNLFGDHGNKEVVEPLKPSYELTLCSQGIEAVEAVQTAEAASDPFAIAFIDVRMPPGPDGIWTAENIRAVCPDTQIVIVTGYSDIDPIDIERRVPPVDRLLYIQKPFHPFEIRQYAATLSARWMAEKKMRKMNEQLESRVVQRTSELIKVNQKLEHQATHDSLTELLNRKAIFSALDRELSRMRRTGEPVSLIMADLDHFKLVNDRYGHKAGDEVLIEAAKRMSSCLRPYDIIGRIGGEEFLVVVPECETPGGVVVAERIREIIGGEGFKIPTGRISVTISMGVATAKKDSTLDDNHLVLAADKALYSAKEAGRNTIHTAEMNKENL